MKYSPYSYVGGYLTENELNRLSPMMKQYLDVKKDYEDAILMFRLGDFYEMFFEDAELASRVLELALTGRNCGLDERAPMCGVPHHAVDTYISRLVKNGYKVAICEQMEDPAEAKGIVKRDIVRVYTPGTLDIANSAIETENVYIASVYVGDGTNSLTIADISTGELISSEFADNDRLDILFRELSVYNPSELIADEGLKDVLVGRLSDCQLHPYLATVGDTYYKNDTCETVIKNHFNVTSLLSMGIEQESCIKYSLGALLLYLLDTQKQDPSQLGKLVIKQIGKNMQLDRVTMRNLELLETIYDHSVQGSLLGVLNKTKTAMGARLLKRIIIEPLKDKGEIDRRLDAVEALSNNPIIINNLNNALKHVYDFQRLTTRVVSGKVNGRDMIALKTTLGNLPDVKEQLSYLDTELINNIASEIDSFDELYSIIDRSINEEPPLSVTEGGMIKNGFSQELDELKSSIRDAKEWIASLELSERERTGIKTLKVGYNKVFGYYIDVSKGAVDKVPDDYIRKQTLVNNERYITPELKEKESAVLSAETKINKLEYEVFRDVRAAVLPYTDALQLASSAIALLDVLISFARAAIENNYVKPLVDDSDVIDIKGGRHPSVEKLLGNGMFVSNDTLMNESSRSLLIITGPNMSGKSTYMRQTAMIVLMAQMGSFVPADKAHIGLVDRVFTRIGASDNLSYGQSTFYVEMSELSSILRNATDKSLIILDEIGRGTSTFDGLSIAWAVVEYLSAQNNSIRTMFATHYHELTELSDKYDNIYNLSVGVSDDGKDIVFLHSIVDGATSKSYGIHVAKIAGIPEVILRNARHKLNELETQSRLIGSSGEQLSFLSDCFRPIDTNNDDALYQENKDLITKLSSLDVNNMTPLKAMTVLQELIDEACEIGGFDD